MGLAVAQNINLKPEKASTQKMFKSKKAKLSAQDKELMNQLKALKTELDTIHTSLAYTTDEALIDSFIFQNMALNMRYKYYLNMCKERGLAAF